MKIGLRYGHSVNCRGARGKIDEVDSCKIIYDKVSSLLQGQGHSIVNCNSNANNVNAELAEGTNRANSNGCDVYITLHMNSFNGSARGVECWCYDANSQNAVSIASKICKNISRLGIPSRGLKYSTSKYHDLNASNMESIIVETLFCDNSNDVTIFKNNADSIARCIANGIDSGISLNVIPNKPPVEMHRNIIIYNTGLSADKACAEYFAMILNNVNEDCVAVDYQTYRKSEIDGKSIFAVGGSLEGKFRYGKIFMGKDRNATAKAMLEHLKKY